MYIKHNMYYILYCCYPHSTTKYVLSTHLSDLILFPISVAQHKLCVATKIKPLSDLTISWFGFGLV